MSYYESVGAGTPDRCNDSPQAADDNTPPELSIFGHFAAQWMPVMVDALLGDEDAAEKDGVNYFLLDMCVTLLRWTPLFPPLRSDTPEKRLPSEWAPAAQSLINFLVRAQVPLCLTALSLQALCTCHVAPKACTASIRGFVCCSHRSRQASLRMPRP